MWGRELAEIDASALTDEGDTLAFDYTGPLGQPAQGVLLRWRGQLRAYRNLCPHWSVAFDHQGKFFDDAGHELMCHVHGATFDPATGRCTFGPPQGASLEAFDVEPIEGQPGVVKILRRSGLSLG